jgi:alpha-aminoadipate/glutamate carrier protein LysW
MLQDYMARVGAEVVCNNCETNLRVESQKPFRVAVIPIDDTYNADMRPESYG